MLEYLCWLAHNMAVLNTMLNFGLYFSRLLAPTVHDLVMHMCACLAAERDTTNPAADDMDACRELYEMTMEIVGKKDPDVLKLAMPA